MADEHLGGRYAPLEKIGGGNYGEVMRMKDVVAGLHVALRQMQVTQLVMKRVEQVTGHWQSCGSQELFASDRGELSCFFPLMMPHDIPNAPKSGSICSLLGSTRWTPTKTIENSICLTICRSSAGRPMGPKRPSCPLWTESDEPVDRCRS